MLVNIFLPLAAGLLFSKVLGFRAGFKNLLIDAILYLIIPVFVFQVMWEASFRGGEVVFFSLAAAVVCAVGALVSFILSKRMKETRFRDLALPAVFMNSGNLGIPAAGYLFGAAGITYAVIFNAAITFFIFSAGVMIASGKGNFREVFRIPVIYALFAGLAMNRWGPPFPSEIAVFEFFKDAAIFLMLAMVGWRLGYLKAFFTEKVLWASAARFLSGALGIFIFIHVFSVPQEYAAPLILLSLMPSAINSFILAEKYDSCPGLSSGAVALTSVLFLVVFYILF